MLDLLVLLRFLPFRSSKKERRRVGLIRRTVPLAGAILVPEETAEESSFVRTSTNTLPFPEGTIDLLGNSGTPEVCGQL